MADRVAVMREGRIEQIGKPEELYSSPSTPFVANFVGLNNRVDGRLDHGFVSFHETRVAALGEQVRPGLVTAFVRPEDIAFSASGVPAVVVASSFLGSLRRTSVRLPDESVISVQHEVGYSVHAGDRVHIRFLGAPVAVEPRD